jgi:hypothetical protein
VELLAKKITQLGYSCFYIHAKMMQVRDTLQEHLCFKRRLSGGVHTSVKGVFFFFLQLIIYENGPHSTRDKAIT